MMHCGYFDNTRKGSHSSFLIPTLVGGRCPFSGQIFAESDPPPFEKRRLRQISAHNIKEIAKKVQLRLIESRPRAFQRAIDRVHALPLTLCHTIQHRAVLIIFDFYRPDD